MTRSLRPRTLALVVATLLGAAACAAEPMPVAPSAPTAAPPASVSAGTLPADLTARIDQLAAASLGNGITGAIVGVVDPARGDLLKAYGTADTAGTPMTPDMHYRIASVTKTFTAQAVLELAGQGRLSFDDPLAKYVPDIPYGDSITVRDLLGMRGGVFDFTADPAFATRYDADPLMPGWTPDDALQIVRANADKAVPPRTRTAYSNSEYVLIGFVLEQASGQEAADSLDSLAGRMGLSSTSFATGPSLPSPFSRGYISTGEPPPTAAPTGTADGFRDATESNPLVPWTAGAMISTVSDMVRYAPLLADGAGLTPAIAAQRQDWTPLTTSGPRLQYGLGIIQLGDWVGHDGSIVGFSDMVFYLPAQRATVVVMVNAADGDAVPAQALWGEIVKVLYPGSLTEWS